MNNERNVDQQPLSINGSDNEVGFERSIDSSWSKKHQYGLTDYFKENLYLSKPQNNEALNTEGNSADNAADNLSKSVCCNFLNFSKKRGALLNLDEELIQKDPNDTSSENGSENGSEIIDNSQPVATV